MTLSIVILALPAAQRLCERVLAARRARLWFAKARRPVSYPNHVVVTAEVAVVPLAFGLTSFPVEFWILNAGVLAIPNRAENRALR